MGEIYRTLDAELGRKVALEVPCLLASGPRPLLHFLHRSILLL